MDLPSSLFSGCACSPFQQFLIVLIKLRLAIGDQDLAYRFGIHQSTVSRYFNKWLDILYRKLSVFVSWPEREQLLKTMPADFRKNFGKCVIVIDCFEVFIERPTSLMARAQTWSNYKKHNTVKFLIGITPQGTIAFISNDGHQMFTLQSTLAYCVTFCQVTLFWLIEALIFKKQLECTVLRSRFLLTQRGRNS